EEEAAGEHAAAIEEGGVAADRGVGRRGRAAAGEQATAGVAADGAVGQVGRSLFNAVVGTDDTDPHGPGEHAHAGVAADGAVRRRAHVADAGAGGKGGAAQHAAAVAVDRALVQRGCAGV